MAQLNATFHPREIPEEVRSGFEAIPPGEYLLQVVNSELKEKDNGHCGLKLTLEVLAGEFERYKLWDYLNIRHSSAQAQSIAQRRLADYCLATGLDKIQDTDELHYRPFVGKVSREPRQDIGEMTNRIKAVRSKSSAPPVAKDPVPQQPASHQPVAQPQRGASQADGPRPWVRSKAELGDNIPV